MFVLFIKCKGLPGSSARFEASVSCGQIEGVASSTLLPAEQRVRRYQATIVITGRTRMKGRLGDAPFSASSRYTHVYVEQQGEWRLVAAQGTPILPSPEQSV